MGVFSDDRFEHEGRIMTYVCYKCGREVQLNIDAPSQFFICKYCGSKIFIKRRPPVVKAVKAR